MGIARRLEKTRIVQNRERDKMVMKRIIENRIFRNLLSAVIFGLIYCVLSFIDKGNVKIGIVLSAMAVYFVFMCFLCVIATKLRKIVGHDKNENF